MKKLSLLLAALMIVCCFALAACGEEDATSSIAATSSAAVSSEAVSSTEEVSSEAESSVEEVSSEAVSSTEESVSEGPVVGEASMFWLTHYNDGRVEGAGSVFTSEDVAGGWWIHVAFSPVEIEGLENVYEIVEITNGIADGSAATVAVPEGGFVWAINVGNDYISIGSGDTDYTSPSCSSMVTSAGLWVVGDKLQINGLDLEGLTVPTDTPDVQWHDDAYVCTATWAYVTE